MRYEHHYQVVCPDCLGVEPLGMRYEHHYQEDDVGRSGYPAEFRRRAVALLDSGRRVADLAEDLGVSEQTLYNRHRQPRIDAGVEPRMTSREKAERVMAKRRIRELEAELEVHRRATELLRRAASPAPDARSSS